MERKEWKQNRKDIEREGVSEKERAGTFKKKQMLYVPHRFTILFWKM